MTKSKTPEWWIGAIVEARSLANASRRTQYVVDAPAFRGGYRITAEPRPQDVILIADVAPPRWTREAISAACDAREALDYAAPHLIEAAKALRRAGEAGAVPEIVGAIIADMLHLWRPDFADAG